MGQSAITALELLALDGELSAYQLTKRFNNEGKEIRYKNVRSNLKRLEKLGLIVVKRKQIKPHAIFYGLTEVGWIRVIMECDIDPLTTELFFKTTTYRTLLGHFVEKETLNELQSPDFRYPFSAYIRECIETIEEDIRFWQIDENPKWDELPGYSNSRVRRKLHGLVGAICSGAIYLTLTKEQKADRYFPIIDASGREVSRELLIKKDMKLIRKDKRLITMMTVFEKIRRRTYQDFMHAKVA